MPSLSTWGVIGRVQRPVTLRVGAEPRISRENERHFRGSGAGEFFEAESNEDSWPLWNECDLVGPGKEGIRYIDAFLETWSKGAVGNVLGSTEGIGKAEAALCERLLQLDLDREQLVAAVFQVAHAAPQQG